MSNQRIADRLAEAGKPAETWIGPDGSNVLVLPYGGRILGLFSPGSDRNFLWTHPALESVESAREFYQSAEWHNSGGDRTWLAPEVDFFFPNFPKLDTYFQPRTLDPGNYQLVRKDGHIFLTNHLSITPKRSGRKVDLVLTKEIAAARNPLRLLLPKLAEELEYAGYTLRTRLEFAGGQAEGAAVGVWQLLQLPHGGDLWIATFSKASVTTYMGKVETNDLILGEHWIRYRMRATGEHKLGIRPGAIAGRAGYLRTSGSEASLVIRNFTANPSGEYIDVPWTGSERLGSAVQACNVNSKLGAFSEMEYHAPAIGGLSGDACRDDESQVWAFRGAQNKVLEVARLLLSPEVCF